MFIVFNKQKIYSYLVAFSTVIILFTIAFSTTKGSTILTSSTVRDLSTYHVKTTEKKVALTINCASNADDIDSILKTLKNNNIKITFFLVANWSDKYPEAVKKIANDGHEIIRWSLDILDYTLIDEQEMWNKIEDKLTNGDIILMHNGTEHTADSLEMIIKNIKAKEFEIVTVSDLIYRDNSIDNNETQIYEKHE